MHLEAFVALFMGLVLSPETFYLIFAQHNYLWSYFIMKIWVFLNQLDYVTYVYQQPTCIVNVVQGMEPAAEFDMCLYI